MDIADRISVSCEIVVIFKIIGGKCKLVILFLLITDGTKRLKELMSSITQSSQKTITKQLRELEADGMISREAFLLSLLSVLL